MPKRRVQRKKREALERVIKVMSDYQVMAAADLRGVRSTQIQEMRKSLRGKVEMLIVKNTLLKKAGEELEAKRKGVKRFVDSLSGPLALLFTDMNPFELILCLNRNKVKVPAKGGDIATGDIIVSAGNTGLPPGPIISEFGEVKIPTKIESGSIWISRDTLVARRGETITAKLASVLTRLGMKPMEAGLSIIAAYDRGVILDSGMLTLDLDQFRRDISRTFMEALSLACEASYLTSESTLPIFRKAWQQACALAVHSEYATRETIEHIVKTAHSRMLALEMAVAAFKGAA
ncbi:50S ribosomal protein L10 [Candidatus Bathyarchaeota archaeon]|nr:50S ribosomal protein L10 [Candidatus Bathyarchaeota archaeon]